MDVVNLRPYDWQAVDVSGDENVNICEIRCWCLDKQSIPHLVRIIDFRPSITIELPSIIDGKNIKWDMEKVRVVYDALYNLANFMELNIDSYVVYKAKRIYYYSNNVDHPYLELKMFNLDSARKFASKLEKGCKIINMSPHPIKFTVVNKNIDVVRKLLTKLNMKYSQWFSINNILTEDIYKISKLDNEYCVNFNDIKPIDVSLTGSWNTYPGILAFDIETYTNNHNSMPDSLDALHVAYMVSCVYQRYNKHDTRKRYGIIIGDCDNIPPEKLENCEIIRCKDEMSLINAFSDVILKTDPEIITGYNIYKYDYPYLDTRIKRNLKDWKNLSRLINDKCTIEENKNMGFKYLGISGRISIDMFIIINRDYGGLERYTLDYVCKYFMNKGKHDVSAKEMFIIYEKMEESIKLMNKQNMNDDEKLYANNMFKIAKAEMCKVLEYCIRDAELVVDLMEKVHTWVSLSEMSNIVGVKLSELSIRGQQIRCLSGLYNKATQNGLVLNKRAGNEITYGGGYVQEPLSGLHDNVICLDFASLYPSIIMAYNICYTTLVHPELYNTISNDECHVIDMEDLNDKGVVEHLQYKFYKNKPGILPTLVRELVTERRAVNRQIGDIKKQVKKLEDIELIYSGLYGYFINKQPIYSVSKVTEIMNENNNASEDEITKLRNMLSIAKIFESTPEYSIHLINNTIDQLETNFKEFDISHKERINELNNLRMQIIVFDKRQWALKITANSFYGFLGVGQDMGKLPLKEAAKSITAIGRQLIGVSRNYIEEKYTGKLVYSDTDSVMFTLPNITDSSQCDYWGKRIAQELNGMNKGDISVDGVKTDCDVKGLFLKPLAMEFEKSMRLLCLVKKKYAAYIINKDGSFKMDDIVDKFGNISGKEIHILKRGIVLSRRDSCKFVQKLYLKLLKIILERGTLFEVMTILAEEITKLYNGQIDYNDLIITKKLNASYKSDSAFMSVYANKLRLQDKNPKPGDRLDYIVINPEINNSSTKISELAEDPIDYYRSQSTDKPMKINYDYYLINLTATSIEQLISTGLKDEVSKQTVGYKPARKRMPFTFEQPVSLLYYFRRDGGDIKTILNAIK